MIEIAELKETLSQEFDLVLFADIASIIDQHGSAFRLLKSIRRDSFDHNQRIVFYSSHDPSQLILDHLQLALTKIDISNWFVIFCGQHNITDRLQISNRKHGNDNVSITWRYAELVQTNDIDNPNIYPQDNICFLPFNSLSISSSVDAVPCCKYQGSIGDAKTQTLNDIMHGSQVTELRQQFKQGIKPVECQICWNVEALNSTSLRQTILPKFENDGNLYQLDQPSVKNLTIMLSSICNFKCRICSSKYSTAIAIENVMFSDNKQEKDTLLLGIQNKSSINVDSYFKLLEPVLSDLEFLHILGGEPFLMKKLSNLLDSIIQTGHHRHITIELNTNASIWDSQIISQLNEFHRTEIILSIDDIGKRFEMQRGGSWVNIDQNIQKYSKMQNANFNVKVFPTVNIQNVFYLDQLVSYCQSRNINMGWWYLETPEELCIDYMTSTAKELVYNKYHNHSVKELNNIAQRVQSTPAVSGHLFIELMNKYDQRRGTNFAQVHPEIFDAMSNR